MARLHMAALIALGVIVGLLTLDIGGAGAVEPAPPPVFADPDGTGSACTRAEPCDLVEAMNVAQAGSTIYTPAGATFDVGDTTLVVPDRTLLGSMALISPNAPKAVIVSSASIAVRLGKGTAIWDVAIEQTGGSAALDLAGSTSQARRVNVVTSGRSACRLGDGSAISDSFCISNSATAGAGAVELRGGGTATLRGITAVATGPESAGAEVDADSPGDSASIDIHNSILSGTSSDVRATAVAGAEATATLDHSNFATTEAGPGGTTSITAPAPPNQSAEPVFVDPAAGDYHEDPGSPTVDAGYWDDLTDATDFDGEARTFGYPLDIGADEIIDEIAPTTIITHHPKKTTHSRKATFRFKSDDPTASFFCHLDHQPPPAGELCRSPYTVRHLRTRDHMLTIRTNDDHGNGTAKTFRWTVVPKKGQPPDGPKLTNCGTVDVPQDGRDAVILAHQVGCREARKAGRYWVGGGPRPTGWRCWSDRCYKGDRDSSKWIKSRWAKTRQDRRDRLPAAAQRRRA